MTQAEWENAVLETVRRDCGGALAIIPLDMLPECSPEQRKELISYIRNDADWVWDKLGLILWETAGEYLTKRFPGWNA